MTSVLVNVIFPVFACVAIGIAWGRSRFEFSTAFATRIVTYIGAPCLIVVTIDKATLSWEDFRLLAGLSVAALAGFFVLGYGVFRILKMDFRPLSLAVTFPNTGNMGLPLALFAFGQEGLALAIIVFVVSALGQFAVGDLVLSRERSVIRRLLYLFRQPLFLSTLVAVAMVWTGASLPGPLFYTADLLAGMTIPLILITLGVSLASIRSSHWGRGFIITMVRIPGGLAVALGVIHLAGLEGMAADVLLLQSAMPSAVFNYFFALKYDVEAESVASGVVMSTAASFIVLPPLIWFMLEGI